MIIQVEDPVIEVHDLTVSYDKRPVLWDVDFTLPEGKMIGIIGPNGSGKTTLIKSVMGLVPSDSGFVKTFGKPLEEVRSRVSYVPQRGSVDWDFPASVMDVVLMGRYGKRGIFKRLSSEDRKIANESLDKVGLYEFRNRQIAQLSGGQQQRVFLARAIAQKADLYLMDEPFVGVDAASEEAIIGLLRDMKAEGKTVIVVHHDLQSATDYFDWIVLLNTRLIASGPANDVFTAKLLQEAYGGRLNLLSTIGDLLQQHQLPIREKSKT
ncbi:MAG: ABC transporter ATP-binding protein [Bacteroidota bacterium]|nr:ABC transporter ATP-binding protein [Bacteroidota bacterium]